MGLVGRCVTAGAKAGMVAGVVYFLVLATLSLFGGVVSGDTVNLLGLVLLVGVGAASGLGLGLVAGATAGVALRVVTSTGSRSPRLRLVGALAAGLPVLALTSVELLTGVVGVLAPEPTTVVVLPTLVAAVVGASSAPGLVARGASPGRQPNRPET